MVDTWRLKWPYLQPPGGPLPVVNTPAVPQGNGVAQDTRSWIKQGNPSSTSAANQTVNTDNWGAWQDGRLTLNSTAQDVETTTDPNAGSMWFDAPGSNQFPMNGSGGTTLTQTTFGTNYQLPANFSPWRNLERGTTPGQTWGYDRASDRQRHQLGAGTEDNYSRIFRWLGQYSTRDGYGPDPGNAPVQEQQKWFAEAMARLERDYAANGWDFNQSGFADFRQFMQGGSGQGHPGGNQATPANAAAQANPGQAQGAVGTQGGGTAATAQNPTGGQQGSGGSAAGTGGTPNPGEPGYGGFFYQNNPQQAVRDYMNQKFGAGAADTNAFFGDWIKKLMGNLIPTLLNTTVDASGKPALDRMANLPGLLDGVFFGGAGTLGANLRNWSDTAGGALRGSMSGLDADTQADLLRNLTALKTVSMNPYMGNAVNNRLDASIGAAQDAASNVIRTGGQLPNNYDLWQWIETQLPGGYVNPFAGY